MKTNDQCCQQEQDEAHPAKPCEEDSPDSNYFYGEGKTAGEKGELFFDGPEITGDEVNDSANFLFVNGGLRECNHFFKNHQNKAVFKFDREDFTLINQIAISYSFHEPHEAHSENKPIDFAVV